MAELAATSPFPEEGAGYVLDTLDDLSADLRQLRAVLAVSRAA